jgi:hypothetical protein
MTPIRQTVVNQQPYDGRRTTRSRYAAGFQTRAEMASTTRGGLQAMEAQRKVPVCGTWTRWRNTALRQWQSPKTNPQAEAQTTNMTDPSQKPTDVYVNSTMKPKQAAKLFTAGTILHEALHEFTGLSDQELQAYFGIVQTPNTIEITYRLRAVACVK